MCKFPCLYIDVTFEFNLISPVLCGSLCCRKRRPMSLSHHRDVSWANLHFGRSLWWAHPHSSWITEVRFSPLFCLAMTSFYPDQASKMLLWDAYMHLLTRLLISDEACSGLGIRNNYDCVLSGVCVCDVLGSWPILNRAVMERSGVTEWLFWPVKRGRNGLRSEPRLL